MAKPQRCQKPRRILVPTGPPTAAWFPMMMLACHMMAGHGFGQKRKARPTCRKPKSSPVTVSMVGTRVETASESVDPASLALSPTSGSSVNLNANAQTFISANAGVSDHGDDLSHGSSEQVMSRLQQPVRLPSNGPCANLFAKACSWQLVDFMPWCSLPRPPSVKISNG